MDSIDRKLLASLVRDLRDAQLTLRYQDRQTLTDEVLVNVIDSLLVYIEESYGHHVGTDR